MEYDISSEPDSENTDTFDFIGEAIAEAVDDDSFWDKLEKQKEEEAKAAVEQKN